MPIVEISGLGNVEFPDTMSQEDIVKAIQSNIMPKIQATQPAVTQVGQPVSPTALTPPPPAQTQDPLSGAFGRSLYNIGADINLLKGKITGDTEEAERRAKELKQWGSNVYKDTEQGWSEAPGTKIAELFGGSLPYMMAPAAAAMLTPAASIGLGLTAADIAAGLVSATQFTGSNLARQTDNEKKTLAEASLLNAGMAAIPQAALDVTGLKFIPGIRRIFGQAGQTITEEAAEQLVKKSILAKAGSVALQTGKTMGVEGATEAGQQLFERLQAGLSITDESARKEYYDNFIGGAVLGGVLAGPGIGLEKMLDTNKKTEEQQLKDLIEELDKAEKGELAGAYNVPPETTPPADGVAPAPPVPPTPAVPPTPPQPNVVTPEQLLTHATTRLQELETKVAGTETTPATPLTPQEQAEYDFLKSNTGNAEGLAQGYGVSIGKPTVTGSQDVEGALGELDGKPIEVPPIYQPPVETAPPVETQPAEPEAPTTEEKPPVEETPPEEETPPTVDTTPKPIEPVGQVIDSNGNQYPLTTVSGAQAAGFSFAPISTDKPMYAKTDLNGVMGMLYNLFGDKSGTSYTNMVSSKYPVTSDKNKTLPKNKNVNQVSVEFRPDTLSGNKIGDNDYLAYDTAHRAIESFTIHNPSSRLSVKGIEARLGVGYLDKFFNRGLNPDGSITYTLKRVKSQEEKQADNERLSKEYLDHINRSRGKLTYKYTRKRKPGLNLFQQSINQYETLGGALKDILARLEKAIVNNEYEMVFTSISDKEKFEEYAGKDPALFRLSKPQTEMYIDIIKHLMKIDPVMKAHLFMDPYIVGGKYDSTLGFYRRTENILALFANADLPTLVHEGIHAATHHYITMHPNDPKVKKLYQLLQASRKGDKKIRGKWQNYGNTNLDEFIAEAFSDIDFIKRLKGLDPVFDKSESTSIFDNLKTIVSNMMKAMGINTAKDRSVFDEVMDLSSDLFTGKTLEGYRYDVGNPLDADTESRAPFKPDIAWHAGDLGYAGQDILGSMASRGTGHFGSGVYFVSKKFKPSKPTSMLRGFTMGDRPQNKADFRGKNMFTPRDYDQGITLHDGLKFVDQLESYDDFDKDTLRKAVHKLFMALPNKSRETLEKIIIEEQSKAREIIKSFSNGRPHGYVKSLATMVMERLGYDGVDVRHIPRLDTSEYGSVVYQENVDPLSKQYNQEEKNFKDFGDLSDFLGTDKVRAIMSMPMMQDLKYRLFGYGLLNKEETKRDVFKYTKDKDGIEHIFVLPNPKTETSTSVDIVLDKDRNVDDIKKYLVKKEENGKKDWIYIESINDPLNRETSDLANERPMTEEEAQTEQQTRQIFNYRGDPVDIRKWEIPERGRIATALSKWFQEWADEHVTITKVQQAIKAVGRSISDMSDAEKKQELKNSRISDQLLRFANEEVNPILKEMLANNVSLEDIKQYLHARHAEAYNKRMNDINHRVDAQGNIIPYDLKDRASGMTTEDANNYLNNLDQERTRVLESIADKWYAIRDKTQELLVESGQETQETIDLWRELFPDYVPLNREQEQQAVPSGLRTGVGVDVRGNFAKRAMGSEKAIINPIDAILYQRERAIARAENNEVGKAVYRLALENPNPDFWMAINPDAIHSREKLVQELADMGYPDPEGIADNLMAEPKERYLRKVRPSDFVIDPTTGLPIPNSKEVVDARISRNARFGDNVLTLKINGRERYVFFNQKDPDAVTMVRTLKNLDSQTLGTFLRLNRFVNHYFGQLYTVLNPIFSIVNGLRDYPFGMANLSTTPVRGKQLQVSAKIFPAMKGIMGVLRQERASDGSANSEWQRIYKEATEAGFQTSNRYAILNTGEDKSYIDQTLNQFKDGNSKKAFRYIIGMTYDFASMIENGVRLATYQQMREAGYSPQQSASVAKNLTINFDKKGSRTGALRSLYLFFNASVRGSVRLAETLSGPSGGRIISGGILLGVMQAMMMAAAGFKEDDPPEYIREHNLVIPTGDGKYITIPMPYGLNILPNTGRIFTEYALDVDKNGFQKAKAGKKAMAWTNSLFSTFSPFGNQGLSLNALVPSAVEPIIGVGLTNKNSFGQNISRQDSYTRPTPGYLRTKETGTSAGKEFARLMNLMTGGTDFAKGAWSPTGDDIDFLVSSVTGPVVGSVAKTAKYIEAKQTGEEVPAYKVPVLGRFQGELDSKPVITSRFYNNINAMYEHELTLKNLSKDPVAKREYMQEHPEARAYKFAEQYEAKINDINATKKKFQMAGRPQEQIDRLDNKKIILMNRFNDQLEKIRNQ
jgi:hypothetical protein